MIFLLQLYQKVKSYNFYFLFLPFFGISLASKNNTNLMIKLIWTPSLESNMYIEIATL